MTLLWFTMWSSVVLDHQPHCINNKLIKVNFMTCKHHLPNANWSHLWVWCSLAHDSSKSMWTAAHELRVWSKNHGISGHKIDHFATLLEAQLLRLAAQRLQCMLRNFGPPAFCGLGLGDVSEMEGMLKCVSHFLTCYAKQVWKLSICWCPMSEDCKTQFGRDVESFFSLFCWCASVEWLGPLATNIKIFFFSGFEKKKQMKKKKD